MIFPQYYFSLYISQSCKVTVATVEFDINWMQNRIENNEMV